jgi:NSS family neurotransmitter:Na+ symporter
VPRATIDYDHTLRWFFFFFYHWQIIEGGYTIGMNIRESSYGHWSSNASFLWVAGGAVIGIGNVARLPYLMSEYGGIIFLVAYLLALLLVGLPLLVTEWMIGRWMRDDLIYGFLKLTKAANARPIWVVVGGLALTGAVLILSFYSVIAGWSQAYALRSAAGLINGAPADIVRHTFLGMAQDPERGLSWHTIFMVFTAIIVAHGFRDGIEHAARRLVPVAFVLAGIIFIYALMNGDTPAAMHYLLAPNSAKFGWRGLMEAIQQAFFTLALGMGAMMAVGSYLPANAPLNKLGLVVILMDTVFSLVVGFSIFSLVLKAKLTPVSGLAMLFEILPQSMPSDLGGIVILVTFFSMMFIATLAAAITLLEPVTRLHMDWQRATRVFAAVTAAVLIWFLGIGSLLSFSVIQDVRLLSLNFFEWLQFLTASWFAPACGLLICIFASRIMPKELARNVFGESEPKLFEVWMWALRFPARIALILLLAYSAGLLTWLAKLWNL